MAAFDHPNRPSTLAREYVGECCAQAAAAEHAGNAHTAALLRGVAHRVRTMADTMECHYESMVSDLIMAALDVRDGGGFYSDNPTDAMNELIRCVNNLRHGRKRAA